MLALDMTEWGIAVVAASAIAAASKYLRHVYRKRVAATSFQKKTVWITGASSGIGLALALSFASRGATLILSGRCRSRLESTRDECIKQYPQGTGESLVHILEIDLDSPMDDLKKAAESIDKTLGGRISNVDIFVSNAGISSRGSIVDTTLEADKKLLTVNFLSAVALVKGILPSMITKKSGKIVFISSVQGKIAIPFRAPYAASKHALQAFADSLRSEIASHGVSVTCVSPGYVRTALSLNAITGDGSPNGQMDATTAAGMSPQELAERTVIAVANSDPELTVADFSAYLGIYLRVLLPSVYFWAMERRARKEAKKNQ